jgi:hypothetical protein
VGSSSLLHITLICEDLIPTSFLFYFVFIFLFAFMQFTLHILCAVAWPVLILTVASLCIALCTLDTVKTVYTYYVFVCKTLLKRFYIFFYFYGFVSIKMTSWTFVINKSHKIALRRINIVSDVIELINTANAYHILWSNILTGFYVEIITFPIRLGERIDFTKSF